MIPYASAVVALPLVCAAADRFQMRAIPLLFCYILCAAGLITLLATTQRASLIVGTCLVSAGSYAGVIVAATWTLSTHGGYTKRSTTWAMAQLFLQCYSILGTKIYNTPPRFLKGHGIVLGLQTLAAASVLLKTWIMWRSNRQKKQLQAEYATRAEQVPGMEKSLEELNDKHPGFLYLL